MRATRRLVASTVTVAQVLTSTLGGYAFTKPRLPGRDRLFLGLLTTLMIPAFLIQIPLFVMVNSIGLTNTYPALTVRSLFTAFGLFMMLLNLPQEIVDAARIDGAAELSRSRASRRTGTASVSAPASAVSRTRTLRTPRRT